MAVGITSRQSQVGRRVRRGKTRPMSEINVTPLVDVMLVLLVIFMVAAPLLTVGVPIKLPETAAKPLEQDENDEPLTIAVTAQGGVTLQSAEVPREALITRLQAVAGQRRGDKIFLRADGAASYGDVMVIMGALNKAGFNNIGLVTEGGGSSLDRLE